MMVKDSKGRLYFLLEVNKTGTILECSATLSRITIQSHNWDAIGFVRA